MYNALLTYLNFQSGLKRNKPTEIIAACDIREDDSVADIGAGGGYFSYAFSKKVGQKGRVIAVDVDQRHLTFIMKNATRKKLLNIESSLTNGRNLTIEESSLDVIFMKDVFHDIRAIKGYFLDIKKLLKPKGRVVIIDFRDDIASFENGTGHSSSESGIVEILKANGFKHIKQYDFLDKQSFNTFCKQ